ncbi:MAG: type II toxin-antitoxin system RelE/ParE family toxin [Acetobacteraceae bacterium]|nr:type II toxin-antitoxin system RelE/ParE family toxin [Acetobacteraceae bacterium]
MTWQIEFDPPARAELRSLDPPVQKRVLRSLARLATNPYVAANVKAIVGSDKYRLRVGDWRVVYRLKDNVVTVLVVQVGHRREIYR